jgi:SAM-dependent methyltransferase
MNSFLDLGFQPPCDSLLWPKQLNQPEQVFPLRFLVCEDCSLAQIDHVVAPDELFFAEYPYRSGITQTLVEKLSQTADSTQSKFKYGDDALAIDIGSNDGTVLLGFKKHGLRVLGVEPTNIAKIANANGVETIQEFFNASLVDRILQSHGSASVVTATNVFAHIAALGEVMTGVSRLLKTGGVFVTESHYIVDLLETVQYDSIYHEHLRYYSMKAIIRLFEMYDFIVTDVERIGNYGGSIRVFAVKGKDAAVSDRVRDLLRMEEQIGLYGTEIYERFAARTKKARNDLLSFVLERKRKGERIVGVGCPGRASTLVNYTGLDEDLLPYIAEQSTSLKLGLFLPGRHIPIVDEARLFSEQPEYALMLSWHYAMPIVKNLRAKGLRSKIVMPLPELHVIES